MALFDAALATRVLDRYSDCVRSQCDALPRDNSSYIAITAQYTSCVTSCAAAETVTTTADIRDELDAIVALGYDELASVRRYLADADDAWPASHPAVYAESARCLPRDFFVPWDALLVPIPVRGTQRWTTASAYLDACAGHSEADAMCDAATVQAVRWASRGVPIVAPHMAHEAPPGQPNTRLNPLAHVGPRHVCVAVRNSLRPHRPFQVYKPLNAESKCAPDVNNGVRIEYSREQFPPSVWTLGRMDSNSTHWPAPARYTYCSPEQYASYLERELFSDCAAATSSLRCFASLWSRRADCMTAVLNVHLLPRASNAFVATIGQSASVLTGLYRCERDISRASIARGVPNALTTSSLLLQRQVGGLSITLGICASVVLLALLVTVQRYRRRRRVDETEFYIALL
ncbi:hypothetical protein SPRG_19272 [Saprolegnia parasitica CBS 223.65]|uniref:Uncharacterized protein n=1 Tax=Saprolegnia parasitica (strain CBS 223.65) TaxID=695850 RepID=A0A067CSH8_SAPPC|nr:hypothetical protein SPRG_19272 [Saprolegnia parasitica CBS 223.65]KDO33659.1 hypothetical protein SPRG_19272 [Saprolegnia parasitica CBS 223.65]|eukprot:XP_012195689.1 hypothetical protein SPRG_19272 [Saprolegnia parasitica CBS 223.65]